MKFHEIRFRLHFCERHRKTIHMAFGISKNGSDLAVWRRVQVAKKRQFSNAGHVATQTAPRLWLIWPGFKHHHLRTAPGVAEKKNLAPNDPVAPRYGRLSETDLGEKSYFSDHGPYGIWRCANTTLSYAAAPRPNRGPTVALRCVLCGFELVFVWSWNGGRQVEGFGACCQH